MAVASVVFNGAVTLPVVRDIRPGWSIREDATSIDILDTSGSTGQVSASFSRVGQGNIAQTPDQAPVPSSEYLLDQQCTFTHPTLGILTGNVTDEESSDGIVSLNHSTVLDTLNADVDAPAFVTGSPFYEIDTSADVSVIYDISVDPTGGIWVASGSTFVYKYDRLSGRYTDRYSLNTVNSLNIGTDAAGNVYTSSGLAVQKFTIATRTLSTIISLGTGSIYDMTVNAATGMIYLLVNTATAGQAVRKYNTSGTLQTQWGTLNSSISAVTPSVFSNYQGIGTDLLGTAVYVASGTNLPTTYSSDIQQFSNTGTYQSTYNIGLNTEYNDIDMAPMVSPVGSNGYILYVTSQGIGRGQSPSGGYYINRDYTAPRIGLASPPYGQYGIAADPNGMGFYMAVGSTITRFAGGNLSKYQALECYLGLTGFGISGIGKVVYNNLTTAQLNAWDGGVFIPWSGNCWTYIKQLAARSKFYITTASSTIYVTDWTGTLPRLSIDNRYPGITKSKRTASGRGINVTNYNSQMGSSLYSSISTDSVISADYSEISTTTFSTNTYPIAVTPLVNLQGTSWSGIGSSYMVSDSSNPPLLLSTGQFVTAGGSVTARASTHSPGSIDVTMVGPQVAISGFTSPFSLAYPSGSTKVPALSIIGHGVITNPEDIYMLTGASEATTSQQNTQNMDSPFINSGSVAYDTAQPSALRLGHGELVLEFSVPLTPNHTLGSIAGSVFLYERTKWRVASAVISDGAIKITATRFTMVSDVTPSPAITVGTHDALWASARVQDNFLSPGIIPQ